jgi:hypothetical protein
LDVLLPILYLKGVSTGDFGEALAALLGKDAPGLSASNIARLKDVWADEHKAWEKRDLSTKRYVYRSVAPNRRPPASEVTAPPSKAATTLRFSTLEKPNKSEVHSVCIGVASRSAL